MENKEKKIRTFIAVPVKATVQMSDFLQYCQEELGDEGIKWVNITQMHFTLKFIGDVVESKLPEISRSLRHALSGCKSFEYSISKLGTFGRKRDPRIIWSGVSNQESFSYLKQKVCSMPGLVDLDEKAFIPHLTFGRIKFLKDFSKFERLLIQHGNIDFGVHRAERVVFYQSDLQRSGPVYSGISGVTLV